MMEAWGWLATLLGAVLILLVLLEVFFAVFHQDIGGIVAPKLHRGIWNLVLGLSGHFKGWRRALLALAGPVMMAVTFTTWIGVFILGFALIYWPRLGQFRAEDELESLGFVDALYFSGSTGTVLGFGDLTPLTSGLKLLAFVESGLGFALLTGIVTYLISVVSGVADRNALALRVHHECEGTADGVYLVLRSLRVEDRSDLHSRLRTLSEALLSVHQKMHLFPILDLYYRSHDPSLDPEPMLKTISEAAIASQILASNGGEARLSVVSADLAAATSAIIGLIAAQHMGPSIITLLTHPAPQRKDQAFLRQVRLRLGEEAAGDDEAVLALAFQSRLFLEELDRLTGWRTEREV